MQKRERLYEVLIRFNMDAAGGQFTAAHQKSIVEIIDDGAIIGATEGEARALDPEDVAALIGETLPAVLAERDSALAAAQAAQGSLAAVQAALDEARAQLAALGQSALAASGLAPA